MTLRYIRRFFAAKLIEYCDLCGRPHEGDAHHIEDDEGQQVVLCSECLGVLMPIVQES